MRKLLLLLLAAGCLMAVMASPASAYDSCSTSVALNGDSSVVQASGVVSCTASTHIYDAACVQNLVSPGGWVDATQNPLTTGNCSGWIGTNYYVQVASGAFRPVCGRYYRARQVTNIGYAGNTTQYSAGRRLC